ncbi:hypothetical protein [Nostoc sp. 'Lobaria pulmonaria (5183) cyanobiont']|uniref:hypothetical protein n=1 Tax=Nostoc sp. 'Lobaria pulmonaria (5183) cyanobiont' TaxID=1618022 RepID=UPI000CF335DE|nr:hypothetical protein [Nostoc sp. 'Lobaria pulmonaria (5183) cyanobiont']AVH71273.1 hypothetical protein NLP_2613 [Nostoc sp. 'Lobaria pulmonaria (5183) cyanobiont']
MITSNFQPKPTLDAAQRTLMAEAFQVTRHLTNGSGDAHLQQRWQQRLYELQATLQGFAHPICREDCPVETIPVNVRQAFAEAIALLKHYYELGGAVWQGTVSSITLSQYKVEATPAESFTFAIPQLCQQFQLATEVQEQMTTLLQTVDRKVVQQKQIIQAALTNVGLLPNLKSAPPAAPLILFQHLFGDIPIPVEAIAVLFTETQIYFCIDYSDNQLRDSAVWEQLSEIERERIQQFLESLSNFKFEQFRHFPSFSFSDPASIDAAWSARLAQASDLSQSQILQTLSHSVSILPTKDAEKYLLHDIWGHNWQSMLTQFRGDYQILASCSDPLRPAETAYTGYGPLTCREIFQRQGEQVSVDAERARLFFQGEVRQRLGLMFTHLIGEMVADVAEFKFIWDRPELSEQLPCSSSLKENPTKLDFAFADLDFLFLRVLQPLLDIKLSILEESVLEQELLAEWGRLGESIQSLEARVSLKQAIAQLYQIFFEEYWLTCLPTITGNTSIYADVIANLVHLQNVINTLFTDVSLHTLADVPFQTLLLLFMGCYCSGDSYEEFWQVDDAIAQYFIPCYRQLSQLINN